MVFTNNPGFLLNNNLTLQGLDARDIAGSWLLCQLLVKSEILNLMEITDLKNILYELDREGLPCLKVLRVCESEDVEYIIDATSNQTPCAVFPILESLTLGNLSNLKEIYDGQDEKAFDTIKFPQLKHVQLAQVPRLTGFCTFVDPTEPIQTSHSKGTQPSLNQKV
jgi:hypothetical protein